MRTSCVKNGLVVAIVLLLVGVAVQPVIIADVSIESDKSEMVEITVEICEVDRAYNHTVMLTKEQAEELDNLINVTKTELDIADSKDETEAIFKDTVVSLNELGLLPDCISVEEAQRLVTGEEQDPRIIRSLERWFSKNKKGLDDGENTLCLIAGATSYTMFQAPLAAILSRLVIRFFGSLGNPYAGYLLLLLMISIIPLIAVSIVIWNAFPISYGHLIGIGNWDAAEGLIITSGLNGIKIWNGSFYGNLPFRTMYDGHYPGVLGFTGINLWADELIVFKYRFYLGAALWVKISSEEPSKEPYDIGV